MMRGHSKKYHAGFTLIKLPVVISIIGLLASAVLASLNSVRAKGRDATRKVELKEMAKALELYYWFAENPSQLCCGDERQYKCSGGAASSASKTAQMPPA